MKTIIQNELKLYINNKYVSQVSCSEFRCKPALQQIFLEALSLIAGSQNPAYIQKVMRKVVPPSLRELLKRLLFYVGNPGYVIFHDLPAECVMENAFSAAMTSLVSFPVMYPGEGDLVISIKPRVNTAPNPSFANAKEFLMHTDLSYVPIMPDILTMCVKNTAVNGGGESLVATVDDIQTLLSPEVYHQLRQSQFHFDAPAHYRINHGVNSTGRPIISYSNNGLRVRYRYDKVSAETAAGAEAIEVFQAIANIKTQQFLLPRFSAIILNQRYALHGRTEFEPTYDENDRELTRSYGSICLEKYKTLDYETGAVEC